MLKDQSPLQPKEVKRKNRFRKIEFPSAGNTLLANIYLPSESIQTQVPGVFFIHGGISGKGVFKNLQRYLCDRGFGSFSYDSSGFGESGGEKGTETLRSRLEDARTALGVFREYINPESVSVIGLSMGADIAINLLKDQNIQKLILLAAAAYPEKDRSERIYTGFTRRLRRDKESWQDAQVFSKLQEYEGQVLIIYGDNDVTIPRRMQKKFRNIAQYKRWTFLILNQAPHNFLRPHNELEQQAEKTVFSEVVNFLERSSLKGNE